MKTSLGSIALIFALTYASPAADIEQKSQGLRPPAKMLESFDGLGVGFNGPQGPAAGRNPSDNSLAVGPNHIVQIVNSRIAVFTKKGEMFDTTGKVLYGAVPTNTLFKGFGGTCEARNNGDAVVRYDQLAGRWLYVMPIFTRPPGEPKGPYSMCYAISVGADPLGPYHRYEFKRPLFPDYPRPAIWPDGYYIPSSTGDEVIQKHACVADRTRMLQGLPATEQCIVIDGVNFLNNADIDGQGLPPAGAPNIMIAAGGSQLKKVLNDDGIYIWKFHVDWDTPSKTAVTGPEKINVAPYQYLCGGQLTSCVSQPGTDRRLDAQGDKIMQRVVYRNLGGRESILAEHSVNTATGGGVRWYEFRLDAQREPHLYQQGTYAPDSLYRWMASMGMDRQGNIGMGYSFGGAPNFPGQRFTGRFADDPPGQLPFHETVLVEGEASQTTTLRWEDYTTTAMDPSDDCTFWYVGDYLKKDAPSYSTRIGSFRMPGCLRATLSGATFFDTNHNGQRDPGEPGLSARRIGYTGAASGTITTGTSGEFSASLPADPAYADPSYTISAEPDSRKGWSETRKPLQLHMADRHDLPGQNFGSVCIVPNRGAQDLRFWTKKGKAVLRAHDPAWPTLLNNLHLETADGSRFTIAEAGPQGYDQFRTWLRAAHGTFHKESVQLAITALNVAFGSQNGNSTVHDPVAGDWPAVQALLERVSAQIAARSSQPDAEKYTDVLTKLNGNQLPVTPSDPAKCPPPF